MTTTPRLRPFGLARVWAPTGEQSAAFDRHAIDELGIPRSVLMENAGRSAAQILQHLFPTGPVVALVGPGNNGGDALVLVRTLAAWGRDVRAVLAADRPDGEELLHGWNVKVATDHGVGVGDGLDHLLDTAGVLVDGILGTGIRGAPRERQAAAIQALNRASAPVVSLDIASGVDAATGAVSGDAVDAVVTVAFGWPKLGSLLHPGRAKGGRIVAVEISFPPWSPDPEGVAELVTPEWAHRRRPVREADSHKHAVGTALVVAGSEGMAGAAIMAGRAALRSGVGLLRVASVPGNREVLQRTVPEAIFIDVSDREALAEAAVASDGVALGPGVGTDAPAAEVFEEVASRGEAPLLLDADALTLVGAGAVSSLDEISARRPVVVTPHVGEMSRITELSKEDILSDRPQAARSLAAESGCAVLLKGIPSLVASPEGGLLVGTVATSDLATAGMGDVLTGSVASFMAQGAPPAAAAALGLHYTGRAAIRADRGAGLIPDDVILHIPDALEEWGPGVTDLDLPYLVFDQDPAR